MDFSKNTELLQNICLVQIMSIDDVVDIPSLTAVYSTPSKIKLQHQTTYTASGTLIKKKLSLSFPGLSNVDFDKFHDLVRGNYQIFVKLDNNDVYEVSSSKFPMSCKTSFSRSGHELQFISSSPIPVKFRDNQPADGINAGGFNYDFDFYVS